jgi:hypothetical protein
MAKPKKAPGQPWRLFICCVTLQLSIILILGPLSQDLLAIQLTADPSAFRAIVAKWDISDISNFVWHFALDVPYPLFYGALLWQRATYLLGNHNTGRAHLLLNILHWSGAFGAACDVLENSLHLFALWSTDWDFESASDWVIRAAAIDWDFESASDWVIRAAAIAAITKWALLLPTVCALAPGAPILSLAGPVAQRGGLRRPYADSVRGTTT